MRGSLTGGWRVGLGAAAAVLVLAGCSGPGTPTDGSAPIGGGGGGARTPAASAPATAKAAKPAASPKPSARSSAKPAGGGLRGCVADTWRLRTLESTAGGSVANVGFSGRGAFDLVLANDGDWKLVGRPGTPLVATVDVAGYPVSGTATVDGSARGRYRLVDSVGVFRLESTSGDVRLKWPTGGRTVGMDALAGALVPDGTAALRCQGDRLTLEAENVTLSLTRR